MRLEVSQGHQVTFHMLSMASCAIVTLSLRHAVFSDIRLQKCDYENWVMGPSRSLELSPCDKARMTSY